MATFYLSIVALLANAAMSQNLSVVEMPILRFSNDQPFVPAISIGVGTPPQKILFLLDSGSSDLWAPGTNSSLCKDPNQQCSGTPLVTGSFDASKSKTLVNVKESGPFFTNYVNGVSINGTFISETMELGGTSVPKNQIGLGTTGILPSPLFPIAGLGYTNFEGIIELGAKEYPNTIAGMKAKGIIKSASFAMYLNDFRATQGSLVFGGIDTAKFSGTLQDVPLSPDPDGKFRSFFVPWTAFTFQSGGATNNTNKASTGASTQGKINLAPAQGLFDALIDSGDPAFSLPANIVQAMGKAVGAKVVNGTLSPIPCSAGNSGAKFTAGFAQKVNIDVPLSMLMLALTDDKGRPLTNKQGQAMCELPVEVADGGSTLGAPFMQAAYIVFDMDANKLLMAQAKLNVTESQIKEYASV